MQKSFSDQDIRAIRNDPRSYRAIGKEYGISFSRVGHIKNRRTYAGVPDEPDTPEVNTYTGGVDAIQFLKSIPQGLVSGVVTSPPYNRRQDARPSKGHTSMKKLSTEGYDDFSDAVPWDWYIHGQRKMLRAALNLVGGEDRSGCVIYQHGRAIHNHRLQLYDWEILKGFPVRQIIVWDKRGYTAQGGWEPGFVGNSHELITVIAGDKWVVPKIYRNVAPLKSGDVWRITPERNSEHPAPFPVELAKAMIMLCPDTGAVCDPYAGSGTVGIAALELNKKPFYLGDLSTGYKAMFEERERRWREANDGPMLPGFEDV